MAELALDKHVLRVQFLRDVFCKGCAYDAVTTWSVGDSVVRASADPQVVKRGKNVALNDSDLGFVENLKGAVPAPDGTGLHHATSAKIEIHRKRQGALAFPVD